jgi:hypothetical protein
MWNGTTCNDTACNAVRVAVNDASSYIITESALYALQFDNSSTGARIGVTLPYNIKIHDEVLGREVLKTKHNTAYVLVSHGKSGLCAYSRTSTSPSAMPTDRRKFNCLSFWNSSSSTYTYSTGAVSSAKPIVFYQGYGKSFDNLVYFKTLDQLVADAAAIRKFATG